MARIADGSVYGYMVRFTCFFGGKANFGLAGSVGA